MQLNRHFKARLLSFLYKLPNFLVRICVHVFFTINYEKEVINTFFLFTGKLPSFRADMYICSRKCNLRLEQTNNKKILQLVQFVSFKKIRKLAHSKIVQPVLR